MNTHFPNPLDDTGDEELTARIFSRDEEANAPASGTPSPSPMGRPGTDLLNELIRSLERRAESVGRAADELLRKYSSGRGSTANAPAAPTSHRAPTSPSPSVDAPFHHSDSRAEPPTSATPSPTESSRPTASADLGDDPEKLTGDITPARPTGTSNTEAGNSATALATRLEQALRLRGVPAEIDPALSVVGPRLIRYRVLLQAGASIAQVRRHAEDIGRELALVGSPLVDSIAGERYLAIDLPRATPEVVSILPVLSSGPPASRGRLPLAVGVTATGKSMWLDLAELPHLLVAGSTNSGKSIFLQCIALSLAAHTGPNELEFVIVDPKATDFPLFARLPHLADRPIITDGYDAMTAIVELARNELERRTEVLRAQGHANLWDLRAAGSNDIRPTVVIIDEYADLRSSLGRRERYALENAVVRLAQRGRSVGLHLVLATQRPTVDVVTGPIKANIPGRISFKLPQKVDSRTVLDVNGAEQLLGQGDMLVMWNDRLTRAQGYFVSRSEVDAWLTSRGW